jgi:hypothetical protein
MATVAHPILRPLRQGEILDRAIRLYRRHFLQFVGMLALVQAPLVLLQTLVSLVTLSGSFSRLSEALENPAAVPDEPLLGAAYAAGSGLQLVFSFASLILVRGLAAGALTTAVSASYLGEETPGIIAAYRRIRPHWAGLAGSLLLALVFSLLLVLWWLFIPCVGWITGGGMLLFLWAVIVPMLAPIIVLEKQPVALAWRRAWELSRRRFWWVLGFALLLYVFNLLIVAGPAAIIALGGQLLIGDPLNPTGASFTAQTVAGSLSTLVTSLLYLPLQVAAVTLLFLDLRVTTEGLDLRLQVAPGEAALATVASSAPPAGAERLIGSGEMGRFAILSVGIIAFYLVVLGGLVGLIALLASAAT